MKEIYEEVYDELVSDLTDRGLLSENPYSVGQRQISSKIGAVRRSLQEWQDVIQYRVVSIDNHDEYESALVMVMQPRSRHKKINAGAPVNGTIVAKKKNGELDIRIGSFQSGFFNRTFFKTKSSKLLTGEHILTALADEKKDIWKNQVQADSLDRVKKEVEKGRTFAAKFFIHQQRRFLKAADYDKKSVKFMGLLIARIMNRVIEKRIIEAFSEFEARHVNQNDIDWIADHTTDTGFPMITFYNHLQKPDTEKAKDFRKGALIALKSSSKGAFHAFVENDHIWSLVDDGLSPFKAIAKNLEVREATIKRMYKECDWIEKESEIRNYAPYLDAIDPQFWPKTETEQDKINPERSLSQLEFFKQVVMLAEIYGRTFSKKPADVVKGWVKDQKKKPSLWQDIFFHQTKHQLDQLLETNPANLQGRLKTTFSVLAKKGVDRINPNSGSLLTEDVIDHLKQSYNRHMSDINDMKSDIRRRLTQPVAMVALEKRGIKVTDAEALNGIIDGIAVRLYEGMSPSDQIKASAYWHSPHVDVQRRFNSAVMNSGAGCKEWEPLFEGEYWEAKNGVRFYPLVSSEALKGEGSAMSHCVGSYSSYCMTHNYHIMSLTDGDGDRLSTLTVQDYFEEEKRQIRHSQNRAYRNADPSQKAKDATDEFIKTVNEGKKIKPDWQAIDSVRAEYKTNQIANQAGYDIRDPEQCQAVLDVYIPCVSKKVVRASGGQFDQLINILGVDQIVSDFIERFDFSQGGLVRTNSQTQIPVNDNQGQQPRPRMA